MKLKTCQDHYNYVRSILALIYIDGDKGVVLLLIVNISGCLLINMVLDVSWLIQATLRASKMDHLATVCFANQSVINVRWGQNNAVWMLYLTPMCYLYVYVLGS